MSFRKNELQIKTMARATSKFSEENYSVEQRV